MSTSQNGWSANDRSVIATYTVPGTAQKISMRRGDVATVLLYVASRYDREVEPLHVGWCWGYAERNIRGSSTTLSNHASGTAIDLNAPAHPLGTEPTSNYSSSEISAVHRILDACVIDGVRVVRWGGDYSGRKDGMHFEINADAAHVARLASALLNPPQPGSGIPKTGGYNKYVAAWQKLLGFGPGDRDGLWGQKTDERSRYLQVAATHYDLNRGSKKSTIRLIQAVIGTPADGDWGPKSRAAMKRWVRRAQSFLGVTADGDWGPKTQAAYSAFRQRHYMKF